MIKIYSFLCLAGYTGFGRLTHNFDSKECHICIDGYLSKNFSGAEKAVSISIDPNILDDMEVSLIVLMPRA